MRYATWIIKRPEGTTPEPVIRSTGGEASGGVMLDTDFVLGYLSDDAITTGLEDWDVIIKSQQEALTLAQTVNPDCFLADDGTIQAPIPDNL